MRRFFKSAAFPILLVVILAFIAQRVITSDSGDKAPAYSEIVSEKGLIASGKVEEVSVNVKDSTLDIKTKPENGENGESFSTGYPPNDEPHLMRLLEENDVVKTTVHGTGSSGLLSLLTYVLPFVLF